MIVRFFLRALSYCRMLHILHHYCLAKCAASCSQFSAVAQMRERAANIQSTAGGHMGDSFCSPRDQELGVGEVCSAVAQVPNREAATLLQLSMQPNWQALPP